MQLGSGISTPFAHTPTHTSHTTKRTGLSLLVCHASLRSPNLKARLASAREEFRAVW